MLENLEQREFSLLGMGEVMLRLSPVGKERLSQCETFEKRAGGSELNVASGISQLGLRTGIITKLPDNEIGQFIKNKIRYSGISDDYITYDREPGKRLGLYYYESGAYPRVSAVEYDRAGSSFTRFRAAELPDQVYQSANVFHISGITLALDRELCREAVAMIRRFKENGTAISFDVNYRAALWSEEAAKAVILEVLPLVDFLFVSEETSRRMFGKVGTIREIQAEFARDYPNLQLVASTKRTATTPTRHTFTSIAYDCRQNISFSEEPYCDIEVVDRIGSGDAYVAGALYAMLTRHTVEDAVRFGNAMSALKNTIPGDMTDCDQKDISRIIKAHSGTGDGSEMVR